MNDEKHVTWADAVFCWVEGEMVPTFPRDSSYQSLAKLTAEGGGQYNMIETVIPHPLYPDAPEWVALPDDNEFNDYPPGTLVYGWFLIANTPITVRLWTEINELNWEEHKLKMWVHEGHPALVERSGVGYTTQNYIA